MNAICQDMRSDCWYWLVIGIVPMCSVWALVYGLCNYLDDNGRTLLLHYAHES